MTSLGIEKYSTMSKLEREKRSGSDPLCNAFESCCLGTDENNDVVSPDPSFRSYPGSPANSTHSGGHFAQPTMTDNVDDAASDEEVQVPLGREQEAESNKALPNEDQKRRKKCLCCLCLFILVLIVALTVPLTLRKRNKSLTSDGNGTDETSTTPNDDGFFVKYSKEVYAEVQAVSGNIVFSEGTPQSLATEKILESATAYDEGIEGAAAPRDVEDPRFLQKYALSVMYYALNGDDWKMVLNEEKVWLASEEECNWYGITCDESGFVTKINLSGDENDPGTNGITGYIPSEIGEISSLSVLNLSNNLKVRGAIPESLSKTKLESLDVSFNQLEVFPESLAGMETLQMLVLKDNVLGGSLPNLSLFPNLIVFDAGNNNFYGTIPDSIASLEKLKKLDVGTNSLTGFLPEELGQLSSLEVLVVNDNYLRGAIPESLSKTKLESLDVSFNQLEVFPESLAGMESLQMLVLKDNVLGGSLPNLSLFPNLIVFDAGNNNFYGTIPDSIASLEKLKKLDVGTNSLTGFLPEELGQLSSLEVLVVNDNYLEGEVSPSIFSLPRMTNFNIRNNYFKGELPEEIGSMGSALEEEGAQYRSKIVLDNNIFVGSLPESLGNISGLRVLTLQGNKFDEGQVLPQAMCELETSANTEDESGLDKILSNCEQVDCSCTEACQCTELDNRAPPSPEESNPDLMALLSQLP